MFARNQNRLFCLDAVTGKRVWYPKHDWKREDYAKRELFIDSIGYETANRALAANDDRVFLLRGANTVLSCNAADGQVKAEQSMRAFDFFLSNSATDTLVVGTKDGFFLAFK